MLSNDESTVSTIVDVTYICNATCKYCQWGNRKNPLRAHLPLEDVLIARETLKALGTTRVVFSGGEPRLHPKLEEILSYYKKYCKDLIIITNGYGLTKKEISRLVDHGATGITISLDSVYPEEALQTRETNPEVHKQVIENILEIPKRGRGFELGINSVVSNVTANWRCVRGLLEFGNEIKADFVKFQPIFNDGYVELNAPNLMLSPSDSPALLEIASKLETLIHPRTNPVGFWIDVAALSKNSILHPDLCGLGPQQSIAVRGKLGVCFWIMDQVSFGDTRSTVRDTTVSQTKQKFEEVKLSCRVGTHCFCTQNLSHVWSE